MKIAILGQSPLALECALRFQLHGAAITWYRTGDSFAPFHSRDWEIGEFTSELGLRILGEMNQVSAISNWETWQSLYEAPLVNYLKNHQEVVDEEIISVTKRFLAPGETVKKSSRFYDLFRIIYRVDPREFIERQRETNPETYQRLTDEFVQSLTRTIEMYRDYDVVLDLRSALSKASLAVTGKALGESRETEKITHGPRLPETKDLREIALIGSGPVSAEVLLGLAGWLEDSRSRLFVISHEEEPFNSYLRFAHPQTAKKIETLLSSMQDEFKKDAQDYVRKLREWQELDDFIQAKVPKPTEPIPRLVFFSGHNVTAVDELIDRRRMFLTLEKPDFREGKIHPENNQLDLKTIGVDHVINGHAQKDLKLIQLDSDEKGYFNLTPNLPNMKEGWTKDIHLLEGIENEIFKLFSPVSAH
jgi:hypothetical protein